LADEYARPYFVLRVSALAIAEAHLALRSNRSGPAWRTRVGIFVLVILCFFWAAVTFGFFFAAGLDAHLGANPDAAVHFQPTHDCLWELKDTVDFMDNGTKCEFAHRHPPLLVRTLSLRLHDLWTVNSCRSAVRAWRVLTLMTPCPGSACVVTNSYTTSFGSM
jgi:hypothetical protein